MQHEKRKKKDRKTTAIMCNSFLMIDFEFHIEISSNFSKIFPKSKRFKNSKNKFTSPPINLPKKKQETVTIPNSDALSL